TLNDGDKLVWYYVVDYTDDTDRDEGGSVTITTEDRAAAKEVKELIETIGTVDENSAEAIEAARAAYEALTDAQKELVSNLDVLKEAEKAYAELTGETIAPAESNFVDVKDHWAADAIQYVADKGLMTGVTENTFAPGLATSRAMITTILYRLAGSPAVEGKAAFTDVAYGQWYSDAIRWAEMNKIVGGYADGSFGPNDNITREQLAVMLWRYAGNPIAAENTLAFNDANGVSDYAKEAMQWANAEGLITGKTGNVIDAKGKATRAEVATILMRYLENTAK
ncbi:MAG: S-layer homology domain-containing protein, partial [Firmicutes bacterium]|nr:S-layer homology domain-containing protein [Bacillota bacterium]